MGIRKLKIEDAEEFILLNKLLETETDFLLLSSWELKTTVKEQKNLIKKFSENNEVIIFVIKLGVQLIGFIAGRRNSYKKIGMFYIFLLLY